MDERFRLRRVPCGSVRVVDGAWECSETYVLDNGRGSGLDGRRTCCGEYRGVERVRAEWVPGRRTTAVSVRSRCRAFLVYCGVAGDHEHGVGRSQNDRYIRRRDTAT